jgi:hypothetical protein
MVTTYNIHASRALVAALAQAFPNQRFDEYAILTKTELPLKFLDSHKVRRRVALAHWLRWAADQNIGLIRDPENPTWFRVNRVERRVLPGYTRQVERTEHKRKQLTAHD